MEPFPSEAAESNSSARRVINQSCLCSVRNIKPDTLGLNFCCPLAEYVPQLMAARDTNAKQGVRKLNNHLTFTNTFCYKMLNNSKLFQYLYCIPD